MNAGGVALAAASALFAAALLAAAGPVSPAPADRQVSLAAFDQVASVLTHPRCMNCHTVTDFPRQGDDRHRHTMNVRRGPDGHGVPGMTCTTCHGLANNAASGVPGANEDWHLAPLSMGWEGLSRRQLCEAVKDPTKNGGRDGARVIEHLNTHLVEWAWTPGRRANGSARATPPLSHDAFVNAARRWIATGAACPAS